MIELQKCFLKKGLTLALAESCTGGLMAAMLTKTPGCSNYFLGSFVTYSENLKTSVLGVDPKLIEEKTAVSKEVATEMCKGALKMSGSDFAIAVTGDAGPDGDQVGTVYGALGNDEKIFVGKIPNLKGLNREEIQNAAADYLLREMICLLQNAEVSFAH